MGFIFNEMFFSFCRRGFFLRSVFLALVIILVTSAHVSATHLRAGDITVEKNNPTGCGTNVTIWIRVYTKVTDSPSDVLFGGDEAYIDFGDGTTEKVPYYYYRPEDIRKDLDPEGHIAVAFYKTTHNYAGGGKYTISYVEANRNEGVLNMDNSVNTTFYLETTVNFDAASNCNHFPKLSVPPIDKGCKGVIWTHNPGASDEDGDSLAYDLVVPFSDRNKQVVNYKSPADNNPNPQFYTNYNTANEAGNGPPSFKINQHDGTITWDAPGATGEYNIAFVVIEYRKVNGVWRELSRVRRDMQIIIEDCNNKRPDLIVPQDTCVEAGTTIIKKIIGFDQDDDPSDVKIEGFSEIFGYAPAQSPATLSKDSKNFVPSPDTVVFQWDTKCLHVRDQPYQVVFKVTENSQQRLASFKTWRIKVVGPAPQWESATLIPTRKAQLKWENYQCANADSMQIWRRVDSVSYHPNNCQTGMPSLGYQLIATISLKNGALPITEYTDTNGLAPGAMYCYRLVALYSKGNGESYVSQDACVGPVTTAAPIITNVTVDTTAVADGKITIKWHEPLEPPTTSYTYKLYRGTGFSGAISPTAIYTGDGLSFTDTGLNTADDIYHYQVASFDNGDSVDISDAASSVRLESTSQIKKIRLEWSAIVPWSNVAQDFPYHRIYRGPAGSTSILSPLMELIDSVNVLDSGFFYLDSGQYQNTPLEDGTDYCYIVETRGTYGNDNEIPPPLINFSQALCTQTGDSIPPCKLLPPLRSTLDYIDCNDYFEKYGCANTNFKNIIVWNKPEDEECRKDIYGYIIYSTSSVDGVYLPVEEAGIVKDTFYIDNHLQNSFKRCYRIAAVDRSGNVGELSDPVCVDNCPYYELPNVFTPNNDDCNDLFSAYGETPPQGENDQCITPPESKRKCPRFVLSVVFRVYNRWGKEVYTFSGRNGDEKNTIFIDWDGRDNNGVELSSGVYYYIAEVTFDVVDPSEKVRVYKGWVHLIR